MAFLRTVLDPQRLAVIGLIATRPRTAGDIAHHTGQPLRQVLEALGPLVQAGVVDHTGDDYLLSHAALRELAQNLPQAPPAGRRIFFGMTDEEQAILGRFFRGETLVEIPAGRAKRRVVLERIALDFEPGVRYPEAEVNALLTGYHADYAALRRYLVDEGLLDRGEGDYWRSGGRV